MKKFVNFYAILEFISVFDCNLFPLMPNFNSFLNFYKYWQWKKSFFLVVRMAGEIREKLLRNTEENDVDGQVKFRHKLWVECKKLWVVAAPAIFTRFSSFGINVVSQAFIGHIGSTQLAAYSLVFTVLLRFANGILVSTLCLFLTWVVINWVGVCFGLDHCSFFFLSYLWHF